jgi:hypothetical protein
MFFVTRIAGFSGYSCSSERPSLRVFLALLQMKR